MYLEHVWFRVFDFVCYVICFCVHGSSTGYIHVFRPWLQYISTLTSMLWSSCHFNFPNGRAIIKAMEYLEVCCPGTFVMCPIFYNKYFSVCLKLGQPHYDDVIMDTIASQITSLAIVYSIVYSSAVLRKHQSSASLAFVWGIHRGPVNSPHKGPVTRKMFPFDDVIMH